MKTVGSILKDARMSKGLSLETVEQATKIRKKFLVGIESDDYRGIPSLAYAKGFVKNYSEFLGLDSGVVLAFYRRQTLEISKSSLLPKGMTEPLNRSTFQLTPTRFLAILVFGFVGMFAAYLGLQYQKLHEPPVLVIESPAEGAAVREKKVDILGYTSVDATVTINGVSVLVRGDGKFFDQVALDEGGNTMTIISTSRYGKSSQVERNIIHAIQ